MRAKADIPALKKHRYYLLGVFLLLLVAACASAFPVPGGTDTVNKEYYESQDAFKQRIASIERGMPKIEVLARLGRQERELTQLRREEIVSALFGSTNVNPRDIYPSEQDWQNFIRNLHGYKLQYKNVKRKHGFTSLIRVRTDERGFSYTVYLIFQDGVLFENPILSGGIVNSASSSTLFDFLTPKVFIDSAVE